MKKRITLLFVLFLFSVTAGAHTAQAASSKQMHSLINLTQQLREQSERYLMLAENGVPANKETLDTLFIRQQREFVLFENDPKLAEEMQKLKRYTAALYAETPDLDAYTVFRAYTLLIMRMIDDTALCTACSDLPEIALLQMEEELRRLTVLASCREELAYDRVEYDSLFAATYDALSDVILRLQNRKNLYPQARLQSLLTNVAHYLHTLDTLRQRSSAETALQRTSGKEALLADTVSRLLDGHPVKPQPAHYSLR